MRVHRGDQAGRFNRSIGTRAFTCGSHIWLGSGVGEETSSTLAHELVHVMQQTPRSGVGSLRTHAVSRLVQRLAPPGNCEQSVHDAMQRLVKAICDPPSWWGGAEHTWRSCSERDSCGQLKLKITRNPLCAQHRRSINDECYDGGDTGHGIAERDPRCGQANCMAIYRAKYERTRRRLGPAAERVGVAAMVGAALGAVLGAIIGAAGGGAGVTLVAPGVGTVAGGIAGGTAGALEGAAIGATAGALVGGGVQSLIEWLSD